ncbi:hypothetical protein ACWCPS_33155 [Streptomyces mauvecolor]
MSHPNGHGPQPEDPEEIPSSPSSQDPSENGHRDDDPSPPSTGGPELP